MNLSKMKRKMKKNLSENKPILNKSKKRKIKWHIKKRKKYINLRKIFIMLLFFISCLILIIILINKLKKKNNNDIGNIRNYKQDNLTLVSAYYQVALKHSKEDYIKWMNLTYQLNCSMIIFSSKDLMEKIKELRPKHLHSKTVFIELELKDFYSYKKYINEFNKTYILDTEKWRHHSVPLYLVWAEKCSFLKKAIINNYFNSTCFYWIDAGYFRKENEMSNFTNNWPSTKKCYEDKRVILSQVRRISENEKNLLLNFDENTHKRFHCNVNVGAGIFGGHFENVLKFINLYYEAIEIFAKKNLFIGKEQNIFTYVALAHPDIVNLILTTQENYYHFKSYLS